MKEFRFLDPRSDLVFKKIFGQHPDLIKSFLNSILPLPEGHWIEEISYLTAEQTPRIPSLKNTLVDVKCTDQTGHIFIVEMQMTWSKSFLKRFLFGTSKAYVQQLGAGKPYGTLCPVYGIALVNQPFEPETQEWFHHYRLTHTKDLDKTLEGIELLFLELPKFNPKTFAHQKVGVLWLRFLRETKDLKDIPDDFKATPEIEKALQLAEESAYTAAELESYDEYLDAIRVEQTLQHDAYEEGEQKGLRKGEQKGLRKGEQIGILKGKEEGRVEGKEEGKSEERLEIATSLLKKGFALEVISEVTSLSLEQLEALKKKRLEETPTQDSDLL